MRATPAKAIWINCVFGISGLAYVYHYTFLVLPQLCWRHNLISFLRATLMCVVAVGGTMRRCSLSLLMTTLGIQCIFLYISIMKVLSIVLMCNQALL